MTAGVEFDKPDVRPDPAALANLERGHAEAEQTLRNLKAEWAAEDEARESHRKHVLAAHARGARDRDAMRVRLGGASLFEAEDRAAEAAAAARTKAADEAAAKLKGDAEAKAKAPDAKA